MRSIAGTFLLILSLLNIGVQSQVAPHPGALDLSIHLKYLNNMLGMLVPITIQKMIENQTFNLDFSDSGTLYKMEIKNIKFDKLFMETKTIGFIEGSNTIRLLVSGVDIDMKVDGAVYALWFIPLKASSLSVTNLTLQMDFEVIQDANGVNWQLRDSGFIDIKDFYFKLTSKVFQSMLDLFHKPILHAVKGALPQVVEAIHQEVEILNTLLRSNDPKAFLVSVFDPLFPLNLTMTKAPELNHDSEIITVNFDGTFFDSPEGTNHVDPNTVYAQRESGPLSNSQQIFIHQSMLASLFFSVDQKYMPIKITDKALTDQLKSLFSEIPETYGQDAIVDLEIVIKAADGHFLTIEKERGIIIGENEKATLELYIYCANQQVPRELAVKLSTDLQAVVNATVSEYLFYLNITEGNVQNTEITDDKIGLTKKKFMIDQLLKIFLQTGIDYANSQFAEPYNIINLNPEYLSFISMLFIHPRVSPFYQDEYLYLGITYKFDVLGLEEEPRRRQNVFQRLAKKFLQ